MAAEGKTQKREEQIAVPTRLPVSWDGGVPEGGRQTARPVVVAPVIPCLYLGSPTDLEQLRNRNTKGVRDLHQGPHRRIAAPEFQVAQIAPLHGRSLRKLFLSPALRLAERPDSLRQKPQDLGFGYGQPSSFRNGRVGFVRSELQSSLRNPRHSLEWERRRAIQGASQR
jgi:hypothetical protein